jgi:hypothetical protein
VQALSTNHLPEKIITSIIVMHQLFEVGKRKALAWLLVVYVRASGHVDHSHNAD